MHSPQAATRLAPGIEEIDSIPVDELSTSGTVGLDESAPCASVPREVVAPVGFTDPPLADGKLGCLWLSTGNLLLKVSPADAGSMADEVRKASDENYSHLKWLRIDGHYAIERILAGDPASDCFLTLDVSSPKVIDVDIYRADPATRKAVDTDPRKAAEAFCPAARTVAQNLLRNVSS